MCLFKATGNHFAHLLAVGGGGMPNDKALAISKGKCVGGGGKLKFNGRLGRRLAIELADGTEKDEKKIFGYLLRFIFITILRFMTSRSCHIE